MFRARGLALLSATSCRLSPGRPHLLTRASLPAFPPPWSAQITLRIPPVFCFYIFKTKKLLSFSKQLLFRARGLALLSATSCRLSPGRPHLLTRASLPAFPPPWSAQITLRIPLFLFFQSLKQKSCLVFTKQLLFRARGIRTPDLHVPNVARYQLRYCP